MNPKTVHCFFDINNYILNIRDRFAIKKHIKMFMLKLNLMQIIIDNYRCDKIKFHANTVDYTDVLVRVRHLVRVYAATEK